MSSYTEGQTHQLADALEGAGYTPANITALGQNPNLLAQIKLVLMGLATIVRAILKLACVKIFDPAKFIGDGWSIWKGPADGKGLEGEEDRDVQEDGLMVIDWEQVILETNQKKGETSITGEERLRRLRAGKNICLGGKTLLSLWEDYKAGGADCVLEKLRLSKAVTCIYFFGTVLRNPDGRRRVLYLYFASGSWRWFCHWFGDDWSASNPSASLASV